MESNSHDFGGGYIGEALLQIDQEQSDKKTKIKSLWTLKKCFEELRSNNAHHLGGGDIRLTVAQQDEICALVERFYRSE